MDYQTLGATGLTVSAFGVGTGGPSRVGLTGGGSGENAESVIRLALDNGVNFVDTAQAYGTEEVVARAIRDVPRHELVLSTKISRWDDLDEAGVMGAVDERLRLLGTDYLDVCHFHAVTLDRYDTVVDRLLPGLRRAQEAGKVRFTGVTEMFNRDPAHEMLQRAVRDGHWDVIMVGFNILNQSARERVLAPALERGVGVLAMFAVRLALSRRERLVEVMAELLDAGLVDETLLRELGGSADDPLGWVVERSDAESLVDAAYRLVRHEPGIHVTLSGTGSRDHLLANLESVQRPPLDPSTCDQLRRLFERVDTVTGQ